MEFVIAKIKRTKELINENQEKNDIVIYVLMGL